jgi:hypothetical protein
MKTTAALLLTASFFAGTAQSQMHPRRPQVLAPVPLQDSAASADAEIKTSGLRARPLPPIPLAEEVREIEPSVLCCLTTLRTAEDPQMRYTAVRALAALDWREHPEAVGGLVYAARHDQNPGLRVGSIRGLASLKACTPEVLTGLRPLTTDPDPWIQQEARQALDYLQSLATKE